jgi:hypothetical protein
MSTSWSDPAKSPAAGLQRVLLGVVIAANLAIAAVALTPDVSSAYRAYFMAHTSDCLPRPVDGNAAIGTEMALTNDSPWPRHIASCGLVDPEPDGTWTLGNETRLLLAIPDTGYTVTLDIADVFLAGIVHRQQVVIALDGTDLATASFGAGGRHRIVFTIPPGLVGADGTATLSILLPDARPSGARGEQRPLGIKLAAIRLDPA